MRVLEEKEIVAKQIDPSKIMQVGTGFFVSKSLLTAVNMDVILGLEKNGIWASQATW